MTDQDKKQPAATTPRSRMDLKILALVVLLGLAFAAGMLIRGGGGHDHEEVEAAAGTAAATQTYTCSMHPEIRNPGPGKCPLCGMDLIPVADDDGGDEGPRALSLNPRAVALLNIQTVPAVRRGVSPELRFVGKIEPDESRLRSVTARVPGRIDELFVNITGEAVKAGSPVARLYSPELLVAQQELLQAVAAMRQAGDNPAMQTGLKAVVDASRDKLRLWGFTAEQIAAIEREGKVNEHLIVHSPIGGIVLERNAVEGMYVETGERLFTIADLSNVWVQLDAYETDLPWIRVGQPVRFTTQSLPGKSFEGEVEFVSPVLDDRTRTVRVRVSAKNPEGALRPNMFVRATLQGTAAEGAEGEAQPLVVPATAPLITGRRAVVYVQLPDRERPTFEGRDVVLGARLGNQFVVQSGLEEGEMVVTNGNFKLDSELQLRGRISMMAPEAGGAPDHSAHGAAPVKPTAKLEAPPEFTQQLGAVLKANFTLVTALADDEPQKAADAARAARDAIAKVDMALVQGAAHDIWMTSSRQMDQALNQVASAGELKPQRKSFEVFSNELTKLIRMFGTGDVAPVYHAMCPMVEGREGYWLQAWDEVTNPYWGAEMYNCGGIVETIAEAGHEH